MPDPNRLRRLRDKVCVVGIGDTDYAKDWEANREGKVLYDQYGLAAIAFTRALKDSSFSKADIEGVVTAGPMSSDRTCEILGLNPRWCVSADAPRAIIQGVLAITSGLANTVALIYGDNQRTRGSQYGGPQARGGEVNLSYIYYAPWGMTSQGAHYAMMFRRYKKLYGVTEVHLGHIAVAQRQFASMNPNAIMRWPLTLEDYLNGRYICEPLRINDYCLVNDGGVCVILTRADLAQDRPKQPVYISGFASSLMNVEATQLRPRLIEFYHPAHKLVREQVYQTSGVSQKDINSVHIYDSFTCHILFVLEGFGFCHEGEGGAFVTTGAIGPGGRLPVNTSGAMLSESYMHGWNHQVEIVKQLRGEAGERQIHDCHHIQYISDAAGKCFSIIYRRK